VPALLLPRFGRCPFGVPDETGAEPGSEITRLRLKQISLLDPVRHPFHRQRPKRGGNSAGTTIPGLGEYTLTRRPTTRVFGTCASISMASMTGLARFRLDAADIAGAKPDQKRNLFEPKASYFASRFGAGDVGNPEGAAPPRNRTSPAMLATRLPPHVQRHTHNSTMHIHASSQNTFIDLLRQPPGAQYCYRHRQQSARPSSGIRRSG
jgi:hypothetical protein